MLRPWRREGSLRLGRMGSRADCRRAVCLFGQSSTQSIHLHQCLVKAVFLFLIFVFNFCFIQERNRRNHPGDMMCCPNVVGG